MGKKRFANLNRVEPHNSYKQFNRWRQERMGKQRLKDYSYQVPCVEADKTFLQRNRTTPTLTWVGHSTFLIQFQGQNIITDPVWSSRMAFHKRLAPPGIPIDDVPSIDVILISHSHYDHLSISSIRRLAGGKQLLVPAGLSAKLRLKGFSRVKELHWWESVTIGAVKYTFVPSQHSTRRNPWDSNSSHWGGWMLEAVQHPHSGRFASEAGGDMNRTSGDEPAARQKGEAAAAGNEVAASAEPQKERSAASCIYFAGDSGYFSGFKDIGKRFNVDIALMPIGAYEPEWFMGPQHVTPEEALRAFKDTGASVFVPMHYGAFKLADDTPREALDRLEAERRRLKLPEERVVVLPVGHVWQPNEWLKKL
ncbi:MBL fold metallo-hydrolase [Paenibacillus oryzae]|uniref:MBL fold metallo-hydrolase n=1 Tax=Paenibacillus oryzae TaxID=1844972 RepID=A0A1A5YFG8_9BACL|nr:MBL fold metallo-hydrolase [Paenibacillus oryzae]OBR64322.1 MBL fold metallo-hydrolase [Paenibacillus oryzae]